jgi:hypothetical protein
MFSMLFTRRTFLLDESVDGPNDGVTGEDGANSGTLSEVRIVANPSLKSSFDFGAG